jgi:YD repeat-containing protein
LITALENFRKSSSLANAKVTTMTYDPLIGVTNIISPLGIRQTYKYDNAGRLERTSDEEAKPLVDFKYNYKN